MWCILGKKPILWQFFNILGNIGVKCQCTNYNSSSCRTFWLRTHNLGSCLQCVWKNSHVYLPKQISYLEVKKFRRKHKSWRYYKNLHVRVHKTNIQENTQVNVSAWKGRYVGERKDGGKIYKITLCSANCVLNMNYPGKCWLTPTIPMSIFCWFTINDWKEMGDRIICNINKYSISVGSYSFSQLHDAVYQNADLISVSANKFKGFINSITVLSN